MLTFVQLNAEHADAAADLHRTSVALVPDYDTSIHSAAEYRAFYRDDVLQRNAVWGAFDGPDLSGFVAFSTGWVNHLYVGPSLHRQGIGSSLIKIAQSNQSELRLYTFQSNVGARAFYEKHGFIIEEMTDGERNEEKMPDITYIWMRATR
ncbi:GNAT family N-acetyltransferase [Pacificimonas flava]|uniref:GNAT family N-acetyltransferase n=1 Tax=Pacificimonas flava TaxID=1234595 RepID=UPI00056EA910|nr:GNAT family N-acetyltransferase [Pacificimonas flava]MBB5280871.1 ribosomal protein S18 acetylase RimI-like enzyme [Pacificimonas flava]